MTVAAIPKSATVALTKPTRMSGVPVKDCAVDATAVRVPVNSPSLNVENPVVAFTLPSRLPVTLPINPPKAVKMPLICKFCSSLESGISGILSNSNLGILACVTIPETNSLAFKSVSKSPWPINLVAVITPVVITSPYLIPKPSGLPLPSANSPTWSWYLGSVVAIPTFPSL